MCSLYHLDETIQWYSVQTIQLLLLQKHYTAFIRTGGLRYFLIGPGEMIMWAAVLLSIRGVFGLEILYGFYHYTWGFITNFLVQNFAYFSEGYLTTMNPARAVYLSMALLTFARIGLTDAKRHKWSKHIILLILVLRSVAAFLQIDIMAITNERDVIFDGLFMAMITSDIIVAKMAGREIHPWVVLMASCIVIPGVHLIILAFVVFYYIAVFADIMNHMDMPLLQVCKNVYCDGVYDLCHVGHKNAFRNALVHGNRLIVGIMGDDDSAVYKRSSVMSAEERAAEVASCKGVAKVIVGAPCFGLTLEFLKKHRIHIVCMGEEYLERYPDPKDDPYYRVPRQLGITRTLPRTPGLSTSELISRIQSTDNLAKKSAT
eukprot:NODE_6787_length_1639_cov_3.355820.p1 GENE.NODE_6787_length_1639_cov_3.355820~~NODE_6787_length_1639_cov_3.355820.p1  ORF type:complete len:374 (+),score=94.54 NODE_6787_length_1639_cov_3.355820:334-1455(+)